MILQWTADGSADTDTRFRLSSPIPDQTQVAIDQNEPKHPFDKQGQKGMKTHRVFFQTPLALDLFAYMSASFTAVNCEVWSGWRGVILACLFCRMKTRIIGGHPPPQKSKPKETCSTIPWWVLQSRKTIVNAVWSDSRNCGLFESKVCYNFEQTASSLTDGLVDQEQLFLDHALKTYHLMESRLCRRGRPSLLCKRSSSHHTNGVTEELWILVLLPPWSNDTWEVQKCMVTLAKCPAQRETRVTKQWSVSVCRTWRRRGAASNSRLLTTMMWTPLTGTALLSVRKLPTTAFSGLRAPCWCNQDSV